MKTSGGCSLHVFLKKHLAELRLEDPLVQARVEALLRSCSCFDDPQEKHACCVLELMLLLLFSKQDVSRLAETLRPLVLKSFLSDNPSDGLPHTPR